MDNPFISRTEIPHDEDGQIIDILHADGIQAKAVVLRTERDEPGIVCAFQLATFRRVAVAKSSLDGTHRRRGIWVLKRYHLYANW